MDKAQQLKNYLECDDTFLHELIEGFIQESKESMEKLEKASSEHNKEITGKVAHKLLSSTRILQLERLSKTLEQLEEKVTQTDDYSELKPLVEDAIKEWRKNIDELNNILIETQK